MSAWLAVMDAPGDERLRSMLADELMARGDPLGELIALALRHAQQGPGLEAPTLERLRQLWNAQRQTLRSRFSVSGGRLVFSGGLPSRLVIDAATWLRHTEVPAPIQRLELDGVAEEELEHVLRRPLMQRLTGLVLRSPPRRRWSRLFFDLLAAHRPPKLRHLGLVSTAVPASRAPSARLIDGLTSLGAGNVWFDWEALQARPHAELEELDLDVELGPARNDGLLRTLSSIPSRALLVRSARLTVEELPEAPQIYASPFAPGRTTAEGRTFGRWVVTRALGARPGLDASLAVHADTHQAGLLLRASALSTDLEGPAEWFPALPPFGDPAAGILGGIDGGDDDSGEWRVLPAVSGASLGEIFAQGGGAVLAPREWAALLAPMISWHVRFGPKDRVPCELLFLTAGGVAALPICPELRPRGPNRGQLWYEHSPEEVSGHGPRSASAVYGYAALLCGLSGVRLGPSEPDIAVLQAIMNDRVPVSGPGLDPALRELLQRCLSKEPDARPGLSELAAGLEQPGARLSELASRVPVADAPKAQAKPWLTWPTSLADLNT